MQNEKRKIILFVCLVIAAVSERLWFDLGPNIELVMTSSVLASMYLGRRLGVGVALVSLMISDFFLGNTLIMIFTWSGFALIAWGGRWLKGKNGLFGAGYGLVGALFFYFYTNFGVWLIGNLYPHTFSGLIQSYVMGLPFLRLHAVGSVLLLSGSMVLIEIVNKLISLKSSGTRCDSGTVPQL